MDITSHTFLHSSRTSCSSSIEQKIHWENASALKQTTFPFTVNGIPGSLRSCIGILKLASDAGFFCEKIGYNSILVSSSNRFKTLLHNR